MGENLISNWNGLSEKLGPQKRQHAYLQREAIASIDIDHRPIHRLNG